jgi:hypothetical protein
MSSTSSPKQVPESIVCASDLAVLEALRTGMGDDLLREVLTTGFARVDELCEQLQGATRRGDWPKAADIALDIADKIANMGFRTVTCAARSFAAATEENIDPHVLRNGAQMVVFEHERLRLGIELQFPELLV